MMLFPTLSIKQRQLILPGSKHKMYEYSYKFLAVSEKYLHLLLFIFWHSAFSLQDKSLEICKRYFREIRSYLKDKPTRFHLIDEDFAIDNTVVDSKLEDLKRKIVEVASQQSYWGEQIPARWLPLEQELMRRKATGVKVCIYTTQLKIL